MKEYKTYRPMMVNIWSTNYEKLKEHKKKELYDMSLVINIAIEQFFKRNEKKSS